MATIFFLKGLPASGKTSMARAEVANGGTIRVNKDDLRAMMTNGVYTPEMEEAILRARNDIITHSILSGYNVVVDDTNLNPRHEEGLRKLAEFLDADFGVVFLNTPLEECIRRDALRENSVGEKVIRDMYEKYLA